MRFDTMAEHRESPRLLRAWRSFCTINPATRAYELSFVRWILGWGTAFVTSQYLLRNEVISEGPLLWLLPSLAVFLSIVAFQRYYRFLMVADELTRKIQLDGISFAFALVVITVACLGAFEPLGIPQPEGNHVVAMMAVFWAVGQFWGHWKYQ